MTDKEIQEQLLAHYKKHYILLPIDQGVEAAKDYCYNHHIYWGVCYCMEKLLFQKADARLPWIKNYTKANHYWGSPPLICESVQEIRSALRLRIDILCKILGLPLNCCFYDEEGV